MSTIFDFNLGIVSFPISKMRRRDLGSGDILDITGATISYDPREVTFDNKLLPKNFIFDRDFYTIADAADATGGTEKALRMASINDSQECYFEIPIVVPLGGDTITIRHKTSSEGSDSFRVFLDDVQQFSTSGRPTDFSASDVALTEGEHTLKFLYHKDGSFSRGDDTVYISKISSLHSSLSTGYNSYRRYRFEEGELPAAFVFDSTGASVAEDMDAGAGLTKALRFKPIGNSETTYFETIAAADVGGMAIRVRYRTDSEGADPFRFYVDETELIESGGVAADYVERVFFITAGEHTVKCEYHKDSSFSSGDDTVYISELILPPPAS